MIALRILSGIGPIWYFFLYLPLSAINSNQESSVFFVYFFFAFTYAIVHAVVSIWYGLKHKNYGLIVLSIIGFVVYNFCSLRLGFCNDSIDVAVCFYILGASYATLFAIAAFILSFRKSKTVV